MLKLIKDIIQKTTTTNQVWLPMLALLLHYFSERSNKLESKVSNWGRGN